LSTRYIALDRKYLNESNISIIKKLISKTDRPIQVAIDTDGYKKSNNGGVDYVYSKEETELLLDLHNHIKSSGNGSLLLSEFTKMKSPGDFIYTWKMEQVLEANSKIDEVVSNIEKNNFSPFESMLYIHKIASNFIYMEDAESEKNLERSRVLPSIFSSKEIVCSGYATFIKAVVDRLNTKMIKGKLSCDYVGCKIMNTDKDGNLKENEIFGHTHNLIYIDDPKYKIKGYYVEDACWDASTTDKEKVWYAKGFAHCLYPVYDLINLETKLYMHVYHKDRISNLLYSREKDLKNPTMEKISKKLDMFRVPEIVLKNGLFSKPIKLDKYKKALHVVVSKTSNFTPEGVENQVEREIQKSLYTSKKTFSKHSINCFAKYNQKNDSRAK
jgi:hypothetical protein